MQRLLFLLASLWLFVPGAFSQHHSLEPGSAAPAIALPDLKGNTIELASFRGKVVLIDFWATWCSPCLKEQPELAELYKKYKASAFTKGNGFEIYGVSFDTDKATWSSTIKRLNIIWTQVSDLKYWTSPVAKTYNIQVLPFNVLIDANGTILATNLHGKELARFINDLLIINH
jgi:thiol-disulfide isomerase/thioredoxin